MSDGEAGADLVQAPRRRRRARAETEGAGQERSLATREKILEAATAGFARVGYDGYSNRMLEQDSGVHHALVTYHFGSKFGLWKACLLRMIQDNRARLIDQMATARDDTERLKIWFEAFVRNTARHPEFQTMAVDAVGRQDQLFEWIVEAIGNRAHDNMLELVRSCQAAGTFVKGDPGILLNTFIGAAVRIYIMAEETERNLHRDPFSPEFVDEHVRTCIALFFRD
jgi:AcrR family transcriptional regulator